MCEPQPMTSTNDTSLFIYIKTYCSSRFNKLCPVSNLPGFRASLGGQKYHASPHKAIINKKEMRWGRIKKGSYSEKNRKR